MLSRLGTNPPEPASAVSSTELSSLREDAHVEVYAHCPMQPVACADFISYIIGLLPQIILFTVSTFSSVTAVKRRSHFSSSTKVTYSTALNFVDLTRHCVTPAPPIIQAIQLSLMTRFASSSLVQLLTPKTFDPLAVCQLHFTEDQIRRTAEAYDERTGRKIVAPLKRLYLKDGAIPCVFKNIPKYLSNPIHSRESRDQRLERLENEQLELALSESVYYFQRINRHVSYQRVDVTAVHVHSQSHRSHQCVEELLERNGISDGGGSGAM
ncbi:hypothetical protein EVAR_103623_1 [Eumeta japonica]|uniref:Uncharacterized protein n=1 Tax=Eumeta variegata TaxID=151549 RepID=A0A4C1ZFV7_EUMVA|nr:hypothetical protein EVAR_103623_1 [Eumeta japonica]